MKKILAVVGFGLALMGAQGFLHAGPLGDAIKAGMGEAREGIMGMLAAPDAAARAEKLAMVKSGTAKVEAVLAGADPAKVAEFKAVWTEFKNTRDTQLIPAIQAGKKDEAKALADGIQAERINKMKTILGGL
ncbi:MAG: hypothetical protein HQL84_08040 [Magnetococcales bacterium]|nr:hypothetical protein [Magnetococcales bacterium]MBF0149980.1 hypothetical protein [Magnetococcales bacterium]MBF0173619.1 hypothetical protein [Magnetococcales bacterium]MBF0347984.1 hypothetical protein [Magnetococcales bacterium]MBF0631290.1 hypothetical protein [Magnetococcales bacterium]